MIPNNPNNLSIKTICTTLTPKGRGAVAVVAVSGPNSESVIGQQFRPANSKTYADTAPRKVVYGIWHSTQEDLIVYRREDQTFEVHCHGGNTASKAIIANLCESGAQLVSPDEFHLANLDSNNSNDPASFCKAKWNSEVLTELSKANTERTARVLLSQIELLPAAVDKILSALSAQDLELALKEIESLQQWSRFGIHLTLPRSVVLCGRPNVGKSSLINAIAGFQRAIVHERPGTTRDVVTQLTAIDGWPVELKDTAGIRESGDTIESLGIEKARAQIELADLKIAVFDCSQRWSKADQAVLETVKPDIIVHNKIDLVDADSNDFGKQPDRSNGILTSTETGEGNQTLIEKLGDSLVGQQPTDGTAVPVNQQQVERLAQAAKLVHAFDESQSRDQIAFSEFFDEAIRTLAGGPAKKVLERRKHNS